MAAKLIKLQKLTRVAFAEFGDVVESSGAEHFAINNGTTERFHDLAKLDTGSQGGRTVVSIARGQSFSMPIAIKMLERHPLGSQIFIPLGGRPYVVIVASSLANGRPGEPTGFLASGQQGVNYARNTWHHPLIPLEEVSDFLIIDRDGPGKNLEEYFFPDGGYVVDNLDVG